jgi:hypothetical protein
MQRKSAKAVRKATLLSLSMLLASSALADPAPRNALQVAQACGWYVVTDCKPSFDEARQYADDNGTGYVINTSSPDFPKFTKGYFCVVSGPTDHDAAVAAAAHWRITGISPDAYAKNGC